MQLSIVAFRSLVSARGMRREACRGAGDGGRRRNKFSHDLRWDWVVRQQKLDEKGVTSTPLRTKGGSMAGFLMSNAGRHTPSRN
jgi:hypothetical protein